MTLVIMAAGMGSRFGGLKQIEPINSSGEFIIDYSVYDAIKAGFDKVVFIIRKDNYEIFRNTIGKRIEKLIHVDYVFQESDNIEGIPQERTKPLGTAHAILCCKDVVKDNFAIINSDDFYGRDAFMVIGNFLKQNNDDSKYAMAGYYAKNTITNNGSVKRGVCQVDGIYLTKLIESVIEKDGDKLKAKTLETDKDITVLPDTPVSMNMFAFTPTIFKYLEIGFKEFLEKGDLSKGEYLIPDVVYDLITKDLVTVEVLKTSAKWLGMTYKEDKEEVVKEINKLVTDNVYPQSLWD